jgi:hypothetical protein
MYRYVIPWYIVSQSISARPDKAILTAFFNYSTQAVPEMLVSILAGVIVLQTGTTNSALVFGGVTVIIGVFCIFSIPEEGSPSGKVIIPEGERELHGQARSSRRKRKVDDLRSTLRVRTPRSSKRGQISCSKDIQSMTANV